VQTAVGPRAPTKLRRDYRPPRHWIDTVDLRFELSPTETRVEACLAIRRNPDSEPGPLELHGEHLRLERIEVDGRPLSEGQFGLTDDGLTIDDLPDRCEVRTVVTIDPEHNTTLSGLYRSSGNYCTQCEAEGFRRITYFADRPDVMATYRTTIVADPESCPVMLSNGNRVEQGTLDDGRHWVRWEDPFKKPSYLFALVAGRLQAHRGRFTTRSGREVELEIWVEPQNIDKCEHALRSLQRAMKWDEETFGLEYDLDIYMVVAVNDFNMGAMENKGLNVFNSKYVLARPDTATDDDYEGIEAVIAHEYFHNWTGNRVTCRDWFQLTLKEGLTVFRDQQFTADMTSAAVKRINDVRLLRSAQFEEDAGPMSHPIRPESYVEMNNFYTATVYIKGAEIVRLYHALLGQDGFRRGMDLYFERHDGQAVTCDDFRRAMADANGVDLDRMDRWYSQSGTPTVSATGHHDPASRSYTLTLEQRPPEGRTAWLPVPIPVRLSLLSEDGQPFAVARDGATAQPEHLVLLDDWTTEVRFTDVPARPHLSLLRGFSAPVRLEERVGLDELAFRFGRDDDPFNRWDAGQRLFEDVLLRMVERGEHDPARVDARLLQAFGDMLEAPNQDGSLMALAMQLPSERTLSQKIRDVDPTRIYEARRAVQLALAHTFGSELEALYDRNASREPYRLDRSAINRRRLANTAMALLATSGSPSSLSRAAEQFDRADNMTDAEAALYALSDHAGPERERCLSAFYERWSAEPLVVDKWFTVQALSRHADTLDRMESLVQHSAFSLKNPNRVRALVGAFAAGNPVRFHDPSGRGYALLERIVLELDGSNPQVASRMVSNFNSWRRFEPNRRSQMEDALERIRQRARSKDVTEIVDKALAPAPAP
jgi:aminopeptidase N